VNVQCVMGPPTKVASELSQSCESVMFLFVVAQSV
jgi:hypothetical protein